MATTSPKGKKPTTYLYTLEVTPFEARQERTMRKTTKSFVAWLARQEGKLDVHTIRREPSTTY